MTTPFRDFDAKCNGVPCVKDCPERNAECHAMCEKYAKWQKEHIRKKIIADEKRHREGDFQRYKASVRRSEFKKKNRKGAY